MGENSIQDYWLAYLSTLPLTSTARSKSYIAEGFGDSAEMADELGALIVAGTKTATCSSLWEWLAEGESPPEIGTLTIVLDGRGQPLCIIETTEVTIRNYNEVDAQFAYDEGEGDRTLSYWREGHWQFFNRSLPKIGKEVASDMPLVCERFRVVYQG